MLAVHVTLIALFLALAAIFHQGKGGFLLTGGRGPGWKKRRAAERDLCQRAGRLCLALARSGAGDAGRKGPPLLAGADAFLRGCRRRGLGGGIPPGEGVNGKGRRDGRALAL